MVMEKDKLLLSITESIADQIDRAYSEIHKVSHSMEGGQLRAWSGTLVEDAVHRLIYKFCGQNFNHILPFNLLKGDRDCTTATNAVGSIKLGLDRHLRIKNRLVLMAECKAYLDAAFLSRAIHSSKLIKRDLNYDATAIIVALENTVSDNTLKFYLHEGGIDGVFFLMDGQRNSEKPIYYPEYKKLVNRNSMYELVKNIDKIFRNY